MIRGFEQRTQRSSLVVPTATAVVLHGALLLILLRVPRVAIAPMRLPGTAQGTHTSLTYLPGGASKPVNPSTHATRQVAKAAPAPKAVRVKVTNTVLSTNVASPATVHPAATNGNEALGTGDVNIALASSFPTPRPDLSSLPHGTSGDVVLDIVIDASGKVSSITMNHGLGHGIDETVIATVQSWSFHPATRDGQPVPSEQELHFHYEKA